MHIEMTELLRCPREHREAFMVLATGEMSGRSVRTGTVGCPVCGAEFPIRDGVVDFGGSGTPPPAPGPRLPAPDLQALLDLSSPGGYLLLLGSAVGFAAGLSQLLEGVHFVGINGPADVVEAPYVSLLRAPGRIPLRGSFVRGVVAGGDLATPAWMAEAVRVLLPGRRLVAERPETDPPPGTERLAAEEGVWVGRKL